MIKYALLIAAAALAGFAFWFYNLSGPRQLNFADKIWSLSSAQNTNAVKAIAYGPDARQKLDIYTPATARTDALQKTSEDEEPRKVLIFFHGGSWRDGEREGYEFLGKAFAERGFVTVIADYRKTPAVKFPAFIEDAASAIRWTYDNIARHSGSRDQIYLMGHSAGAHIAMMAALDPQYLAKQGLDGKVIKGVIGLAGPYDFLPFTSDGAKAALGDWPRPNETQPIYYAGPPAPPMLLLTGDKDETVKPRNSSALAAAISKSGGSAAVKIYPGVDHAGIMMAVARPFRSKATVVDDTTAFLTRP